MRDLVRVRSLQPDLEYVFKHALTQEVVYNGLLKKERQEIHERIGLVMEQLFHDRLPEFYEAMAFHFKQGRSLVKAVDYLMKAGAKSLSRFAVEESLQYYKEAHALLSGKRDKTQEEEALLIDLLIDWGLAFYYKGDFKTYLKLAMDHEYLAQSLGDKARQGMFYAWLGWANGWRADLRTGYQHLLNALRLGEDIQNEQVKGYACMWLCWTCAELGLLDDAIFFGKRALEIAKTLEKDQYLYSKTQAGMDMAYFYRGEWRNALEIGTTVLAHGERHSNVRSMVLGHVGIALAHFIHGDFDACIESSQKAADVSADPMYFQWARFIQSFGYLFTGRFEEARAVAGEVAKFSSDFGTEWIGQPAEAFLAVVTIVTGNFGQGVDRLQELQRTFLEGGRKCVQVILESILGNVYLNMALGEGHFSPSIILKNLGFLIKNLPFAAKRAEAHFNKAIDIAQEIGARGMLGQAYFDLGRLHKGKKRKDKAREFITKAIEYFELCEAGTWLKRAREELASLE